MFLKDINFCSEGSVNEKKTEENKSNLENKDLFKCKKFIPF